MCLIWVGLGFGFGFGDGLLVVWIGVVLVFRCGWCLVWVNFAAGLFSGFGFEWVLCFGFAVWVKFGLRLCGDWLLFCCFVCCGFYGFDLFV